MRLPPVLLAAASLVLAASASPRATAASLPGSTARATRFEATGHHMGTTFRLVLYADSQNTADAARDAAFAVISDLDQRLTDYRPDSELMQACATAWQHPVRLSPQVFELLATSQQLAARTGGAFDITVGALTRVWRRARRENEMPSADELAAARAVTGWQLLTLDPAEQTISLAREGVRLDVGGNGKGYAADKALAAMRARGVDRAMVVAGGDIAIGAPPPDEPGWRIALAPFDDVPAPGGTLTVAHAGVSTSGDAEQWMEIAGTRYSHIIDPRTGLPVTGRHAVTIVAPDATTSDGLDTATSVLGDRAGAALVDATPGASALFGTRDAAGAVRWTTSKAWHAAAGRP